MGVPHASPLVRRFGVSRGAHRDHERVGAGRACPRRRPESPGARASRAAPKRWGGGESDPPRPERRLRASDWCRDAAHPRPESRRGRPTELAERPHVTQNDEADITELERSAGTGRRMRPTVRLSAGARDEGSRRRRRVPEVPGRPGARRTADREDLPSGGREMDQTVVPVIRDADRKGKPRSPKRSPISLDERGAQVDQTIRVGRFTISVRIGGGHSPIVNAPEVAILGLSKTRVVPVWQGPSPLDSADEDAFPSQRAPAASFRGSRFRLPLHITAIDGADAVHYSRGWRASADPSFLLLKAAPDQPPARFSLLLDDPEPDAPVETAVVDLSERGAMRLEVAADSSIPIPMSARLVAIGNLRATRAQQRGADGRSGSMTSTGRRPTDLPNGAAPAADLERDVNLRFSEFGDRFEAAGAVGLVVAEADDRRDRATPRGVRVRARVPARKDPQVAEERADRLRGLHTSPATTRSWSCSSVEGSAGFFRPRCRLPTGTRSRAAVGRPAGLSLPARGWCPATHRHRRSSATSSSARDQRVD